MINKIEKTAPLKQFEYTKISCCTDWSSCWSWWAPGFVSLLVLDRPVGRLETWSLWDLDMQLLARTVIPWPNGVKLSPCGNAQRGNFTSRYGIGGGFLSEEPVWETWTFPLCVGYIKRTFYAVWLTFNHFPSEYGGLDRVSLAHWKKILVKSFNHCLVFWIATHGHDFI